MANKIQFKRGIKASLPALAVGEPAVCTDTGGFFVGAPTGNIEYAKASDLADITKYSTYKTNKDANGIYTTVQLKKTDGTKNVQSVLSGGTSPNYTTRTETWYKADGITVDITKIYTRTYDSDSLLINEVMN